MSIELAKESDFDTVRYITYTTIREIYPRYYPRGAVEFFLAHHSDENIKSDILNECVFVCCDPSRTVTGTVTVKKNEILRLFVLPQYQGNGYGKALLDFAESEIAKNYNEIIIDASLCAKPIYLKRGYQEIEYRVIRADNDYLCYDIMKKETTGA